MTVVNYDVDGRPRDWRGLVVPHPIPVAACLKALPDMLEQFETIPDEFWAVDGEEAIVSCPCGETPAIPMALLRSCDCHRVFFYTGRDVRAANRPGQYAESPVEANPIE